jgi:ABC-type Na+ transport system ATPase subunit NatA
MAVKFASHEEARQASWKYYRRLTSQQRLDILLELIGMSRKEADASSERLERVYRITELRRS